MDAHAQRAALVLRDLLGFSAADAAEVLSTDCYDAARAALEARLPPPRQGAPPPHSPRERALVARFAARVLDDDVDHRLDVVTTRVGDRPAIGIYLDGALVEVAVLTLDARCIARVTCVDVAYAPLPR